jgi:hypothetical protein
MNLHRIGILAGSIALWLAPSGSTAEPGKDARAMTGYFTEPALTSAKLSGAHALRCTARPRDDKPVGPPAGKFPSLYERSLELSQCTQIHGKATAPAIATLTGYTQLSTAQRADDPREAMLSFDTQRLFDRPWPATFPVLVIVGGPPVSAPMGANQKPPTLTGTTEAVRAFALTGADAGLATAIPRLVGWQARHGSEATRAALEAGHPLVALDALRVAVDDGDLDSTVNAGTDLLHPMQPSAVRAQAIELVAAAIAKAKAGSPEADRLIEVALTGWEIEQRARVDLAYVRSLQHAAPQLRASKLHGRVRALADAPNAREQEAALKDLAAAIK